MKIIILIIITIYLNIGIVKGQSDTLWSAVYSSSGDMSMDKSMFVVTDSDNNIIITGVTSDKGINDNITTIKYTKDGVKIWEANYNGEGNYHDRPFDLQTDKYNNILITGSSTGANGTASDIITLKYSPDGKQMFAKRFASDGGLLDEGRSLGIDDLGNVYITGAVAHIATSNSGQDWLTVKYDTLGNIIWSVSFDENISNDTPNKLTLDSKGNVYVTGQANSPASHIVTIKYDSTGNLIWKAKYDGESNSADEPTEIKIDDEGNVYVSGHSYEKSSDWLLIKYDNNGNQIWKTNFNGDANSKDESYKMLLDGKGNIYMAGVTTQKKNKIHRCIIKFDSSGNIIWKNVSENPISKNSPKIDMCIDKSGNLVVTGSTVIINKSGISEMAADVISSDGKLIKQFFYNGGAGKFPIVNAITIDSENKIILTGFSYALAGMMDYITVKFK